MIDSHISKLKQYFNVAKFKPDAGTNNRDALISLVMVKNTINYKESTDLLIIIYFNNCSSIIVILQKYICSDNIVFLKYIYSFIIIFESNFINNLMTLNVNRLYLKFYHNDCFEETFPKILLQIRGLSGPIIFRDPIYFSKSNIARKDSLETCQNYDLCIEISRLDLFSVRNDMTIIMELKPLYLPYLDDIRLFTLLHSNLIKQSNTSWQESIKCDFIQSTSHATHIFIKEAVCFDEASQNNKILVLEDIQNVKSEESNNQKYSYKRPALRIGLSKLKKIKSLHTYMKENEMISGIQTLA